MARPLERAEKCRSALRPGGRRPSLWRGVLCSVGCGWRHAHHRMASAVPQAVQAALTASRSCSCCYAPTGTSGIPSSRVWGVLLWQSSVGPGPCGLIHWIASGYGTAGAMTNADRVIEALGKHGPSSDSRLAQITGIRPHQQINQLCRKLEAKGVLRRVQSVDGTITNILTTGAQAVESPIPQPRPKCGTQRIETVQGARPLSPPLDTKSALFIIPCSGEKRRGGSRDLTGPSVFGLLDDELGTQLRNAREALRRTAAVDESRLMPAWQRYQGNLYKSAGPSLAQAISDGANVVILSGGYGVLLAQEPIGYYNRQFTPSDWPPGLLRRCLEAVVRSLEPARVLAFCARTTNYARIVREVRWRQLGVDASLIMPEMGGRGGGMVFVPRASGEAIRAAYADTLTTQWRSSDGIANIIEPLR